MNLPEIRKAAGSVTEGEKVDPQAWVGWYIASRVEEDNIINIHGCAFCNNMGTFELRSACCGDVTEYSSMTGEEKCVGCGKAIETQEDYLTLECPACLNHGYLEVKRDLPKVLKAELWPQKPQTG